MEARIIATCTRPWWTAFLLAVAPERDLRQWFCTSTELSWSLCLVGSLAEGSSQFGSPAKGHTCCGAHYMALSSNLAQQLTTYFHPTMPSHRTWTVMESILELYSGRRSSQESCQNVGNDHRTWTAVMGSLGTQLKVLPSCEAQPAVLPSSKIYLVALYTY